MFFLCKKNAPGGGRGCGISSQSGLTLIYVIVGMVVISILGLGIHNMTSRTAVNQARRLSHDQVIYLARSGMNHAGAWYQYYMEDDELPAVPAKANAFQDELDDYSQDLGAGEFSLEVSDGASPFEKQVRANGMLSGSTYTLYKNFDFSSAVPPGGSGEGNYALASPNADLTTADGSQIEGSVAGQNVTLGEDTQVQADGAGNGGNVVAEGNVSLEDDSSVEGNICTGGNVTLADAVVGGDIRAGGNVILEWGSEVQGSVYAEGNVVLLGALVYGDIHASGNVNIFVSEVFGSIFAGGNVGVWGFSFVHGDIHTAGSYDHGLAGAAGGSIYYEGDEGFMYPEAPAECPDISSPPHHGFTAGGDDISIGRHEIRVLAPDSYGTLETDHHATLTLAAGTYYTDSYFFEAMDIDRQHELRLDLSEEGSITVFVTGDVSFGRQLEILVSTDGINYDDMEDVDPALAARVYFETMGSFSIERQSEWFGTIYAEDGIDFSNNNSLTLIGSYYTKGVIVNDNALDVTYVASDYAAENW